MTPGVVVGACLGAVLGVIVGVGAIVLLPLAGVWIVWASLIGQCAAIACVLGGAIVGADRAWKRL